MPGLGGLGWAAGGFIGGIVGGKIAPAMCGGNCGGRDGGGDNHAGPSEKSSAADRHSKNSFITVTKL